MALDGGFSARRRNYAFVSHRRDDFIEWLKHLLLPPFELRNMDEIGTTLRHVEQLIDEARTTEHSRLRGLVPSVWRFFTPLPLEEAFHIYNAKYRITNRLFIPPSFNDMRHILNLSQVMAFAKEPNKLKLITFDGDQTLYADGENFTDQILGGRLLALLEVGCNLAVVTAASYGDRAEPYEARLGGLLSIMKDHNISEEACNRFYVLGGECNYLFQLQENYRLKYLSELKMMEQSAEVNRILDLVEQILLKAVEELNLNARVMRKPLSCGLISSGSELRRESLDECCLRMQHGTMQANVTFPFCAFNGGRDAWFDVGNKRLGIETLQTMFNIAPANSLHVGDQLLSTGNDYSARSCCPVSWITSPNETKKILSLILRRVFRRSSLPCMTFANSLVSDFSSPCDTPRTGKFTSSSGERSSCLLPLEECSH
eukprot:GEMP01024499.1.p1 GENE.GEMP01024499.1~~GEMP01024499.1.p1  ORF type:complete len:429 (+),score=69.74 GEMP01024499.1:228-1514(+)